MQRHTWLHVILGQCVKALFRRAEQFPGSNEKIPLKGEHTEEQQDGRVEENINEEERSQTFNGDIENGREFRYVVLQ